MKKGVIPFKSQLFKNRLHQNLNILNAFYRRTFGGTVDSFDAEVLDWMYDDDFMTGEYFLGLVVSRAEHYMEVPIADRSDDVDAAMEVLCTACAYTVKALEEIDKNKPNQSLFVDNFFSSIFWCAQATAIFGVTRAADKFVAYGNKVSSRKGGISGPNAIRRLVIKEAWTLAEQHCEGRSKKPTQNSVATAIEDKLLEFARKHSLKYSPDRFHTTVNGWLRTMPKRGDLFKTPHSTRRPRDTQ